MTSSATNFNDGWVLMVLYFLCFLVPAVLYTVSVLMYHLIQKRREKTSYYLLSFLVSGIIGMLVLLFLGYVWLKSD